jgi:hypothetical protein
VRWIERSLERGPVSLKTIFRASKRTVGTKIEDDLLQLRRFGHNPSRVRHLVEKEVDFWRVRRSPVRAGPRRHNLQHQYIQSKHIRCLFLGPALLVT